MATLVTVGTGISVGQLTSEARDWLENAKKVLYCVSDAATERLILSLNPEAESLYRFYGENKRRSETYEEMVDRTLECLQLYETLAVAYYGHPGFFVYPSQKAIRLAQERGHEAFMLPGVSSFDCMVADLGINVASGCQIFEATDLMIRQRYIDVNSHLIILQVSSLGDIYYSYKGFDHRNLDSLRRYLLKHYPGDFGVMAYYASQFSVGAPRIETINLDNLSVEVLKSISTLYVPPRGSAPIHLKMLKEYGLDEVLLNGKRLIPLNSSNEGETVD